VKDGRKLASELREGSKQRDTSSAAYHGLKYDGGDAISRCQAMTRPTFSRTVIEMKLYPASLRVYATTLQQIRCR
jgi:hypothetical protein